MTRELRHPAIGVVLPRERVTEGIGQDVECAPLGIVVVANRVRAHHEPDPPKIQVVARRECGDVGAVVLIDQVVGRKLRRVDG